MKHIFSAAFAAILLLAACKGHNSTDATDTISEATPTLTHEQIKSKSFEELFDTIDVRNIQEDIFTLIGQDYGILTAGDSTDFNSMVTSWGGWGEVFGKPGMFHFLRSNRYTLEKMKEHGTYTVTFFPEEYRDDYMQFGMKSGRDTDKMKTTNLTMVMTPDGNPAYKEAKLIIECKLAEVTTVSPDDFYNPENRKFVEDAHAETGDWHKVVMGEITKAWKTRD
jgi:flavin reductase (DIM6/NTAB) family NADH-FMN oxidoreductase RutF